MILYHYTHPGTVLLITATGLKPRVRDDNAHMTSGAPVVWLTRQESNIVTADDVAHMKRLNTLDRKEGDLMFGGTARLSVHIERHNKRLMRYTDFLRKSGADLDFFKDRLTPIALNQWWIYTAEIPPHKIDTRLPAVVMLECVDHHIRTHPDEDARQRFMASRIEIFRLATEHPYHPVSFVLANDNGPLAKAAA